MKEMAHSIMYISGINISNFTFDESKAIFLLALAYTYTHTSTHLYTFMIYFWSKNKPAAMPLSERVT